MKKQSTAKAPPLSWPPVATAIGSESSTPYTRPKECENITSEARENLRKSMLLFRPTATFSNFSFIKRSRPPTRTKLMEKGFDGELANGLRKDAEHPSFIAPSTLEAQHTKSRTNPIAMLTIFIDRLPAGAVQPE